MTLKPDPVLVEVTRGKLVESRHRGAVAVCDASGRVTMALGDIVSPVYPRSAFKMLQALPLVESGAADAFRLTGQELSLACASHSGEAFHVKAAASMLKKIGCKADDLACGPHLSLGPKAAAAMLRAGTKPTRLHNNCSGKHAGFLCCAVHAGLDVKGYERVSHPVQKAARRAIGEMCGVAPASMPVGIDGCAAPNFAMPLKALATGFARLADPSRLGEARQQAIARLMQAVTSYPLFESGTGREDAVVMADALPGTMTKVGAEGVMAAAIPALGLGVAVKVEDGAGRGAATAMAALLVKLGALPARSKAAKAFVNAPVTNWRGDLCGVKRAGAALAAL
ncbi:MAG: asparaginase [Micropepsaceae bacterium]